MDFTMATSFVRIVYIDHIPPQPSFVLPTPADPLSFPSKPLFFSLFFSFW